MNTLDDIISDANATVAAANAVIAYANDAAGVAAYLKTQAPAPAAPVWPTPMDCLGGTVPVATAVLQTDMSFISPMLTYFGRMQSNVPAGSIPVIGDSITQAMAVNAIHPACLNFGIGGDTMRSLLGHINFPMMHNAGAAVIMIGINDLADETARYGGSQAIADVNYMWDDRLAPWMTGKWVVCAITPVSEGLFSGASNSSINAVNAHLEAKFSGNPNVQFVNVNAQLAPTGQLAYHIGDGLHLNGAGYDILRPAIKAALTALGV